VLKKGLAEMNGKKARALRKEALLWTGESVTGPRRYNHAPSKHNARRLSNGSDNRKYADGSARAAYRDLKTEAGR
jgi:hypothetical protein